MKAKPLPLVLSLKGGSSSIRFWPDLRKWDSSDLNLYQLFWVNGFGVDGNSGRKSPEGDRSPVLLLCLHPRMFL